MSHVLVTLHYYVSRAAVLSGLEEASRSPCPHGPGFKPQRSFNTSYCDNVAVLTQSTTDYH